MDILNDVVTACEDDGRRQYRDDLLAVSAAVISSAQMDYGTVTDKDIDTAVCIADRLIRKVDKFIDGPADRTPPLPLAEIDDAA